MKAKLVTVGEIVVRDAKVLAKLMEAIGGAELLPRDSDGEVTPLRVTEIDEKEVEYRKLALDEKARFSDWKDFAAGIAKDEISLAWDALNYTAKNEHGFNVSEYQRRYVRLKIEKGDRAAVERMIASFGPVYHKRMPQDLQVEIDAFLAGKTLNLDGVKRVANGDEPAAGNA